MLIPFCLWMKILFMELAFESRQSMGQTKIDALGLSTCHQFRRYLENKNAAFNHKIELQQNLMSTQVALCTAEALSLSAIGGPPAYQARMRLCNQQLIYFEKIGKALTTIQEMSLRAFILSQRFKFDALKFNNRLDSKLRYQIPQVQAAVAGLKRKPLSFGHQASESFIAGFGQRRYWPRTWIAKPPQFSHEFSVWIQKDLMILSFKGNLSMEIWSSKKIQESACSLIEKKPGYQYEVKR